MAGVYDRLFREALVQALPGGCRTLAPDYELGSSGARVALFCEPDPDRLETLLPFGLLRRFLAQGPAAFEYFHECSSVSADVLLESLYKSLVLRHPMRWPSRPGEPWLWVVTGERPPRISSAFGLAPERGWPRGVYASPSAYRMRLLVVNELPRTRDTLLLRLFGTGKPLGGALIELDELGVGHPIGALMIPLIVRRHLECRDQEPAAPEVAEFSKDTRNFCEAWLPKLDARTLRQG